jgi:hypothetical protein
VPSGGWDRRVEDAAVRFADQRRRVGPRGRSPCLMRRRHRQLRGAIGQSQPGEPGAVPRDHGAPARPNRSPGVTGTSRGSGARASDQRGCPPGGEPDHAAARARSRHHHQRQLARALIKDSNRRLVRMASRPTHRIPSCLVCRLWSLAPRAQSSNAMTTPRPAGGVRAQSSRRDRWAPPHDGHLHRTGTSTGRGSYPARAGLSAVVAGFASLRGSRTNQSLCQRPTAGRGRRGRAAPEASRRVGCRRLEALRAG